MTEHTKYPLAERFKSVQGEGLFTGTPMAFLRFVGCSVGKDVCTACDTDFTHMNKELGGGLYTAEEIVEWAGDYKHFCLTGGEPLDRDISELVHRLRCRGMVHIETSGTVMPKGFDPVIYSDVWLTVSPKPGFLNQMINAANELKVIYGGLGENNAYNEWPCTKHAVDWADSGKLVYLQPRNYGNVVDIYALREVVKVANRYPQLRVSAQLHKFISVR